MSTNDNIQVNATDLGDLFRKFMKQSWTESKKWPNHTGLEVEVKWLLNKDGSTTPDIKATPLR